MGQYETKEEQFTPFSELCRFADEFGYRVELEKPFKEFENLFLFVFDEDGNVLKKVTLDDITEANKYSASILNDLSKVKRG